VTSWARPLKAQVATLLDKELDMLLKTISRARGGVRLGATRMNNHQMIRTHRDNRQRGARGRELI
jgi:hypothetical protein